MPICSLEDRLWRERHMIDTGFLVREATGSRTAEPAPEAVETTLVGARFCPKCNSPSLVFQEGCHTCLACGYSKCS